MGIDAYIFAKKAKRCFYFDRLYNFRVYDLVEADPEHERLVEQISRKGGTAEEVLKVTAANISYWLKDERKYGASWNEDIQEFVKAFPDDTYFIRHDHEDPSSWDVRDAGGYVEWLP